MKNDPCPCGSRKKHRQCCWLRRFDHRAAGPDPALARPAVVNRLAWRPPLDPDLTVRAFAHERREWTEARLGDVSPGQEFVAHGRLYHVLRPDVYAEDKLLDVAGLPDADRPYDPRNCRTPKSRDVVYAYAADGQPLGHRLLANLDPGQRCVFQGLVYHIKPGPTPGTGTLVGNGEVDHRPDHRLYVWVEYTITDALGMAEVGYRYPAGRVIPLADGTDIPVENLVVGAVFVLEEGGTATVTRVGVPKQWESDKEYRDAYGNGFRRVVGTFKFTGWVPLMSVRVGGETHRVTPGHRYWSETRQGWYPIGTFAVGELLRTRENRPIPIERLTPPGWEHTTVYNFEVDEYHTYFVGRGTTAVWSHNGLGGAGCGVPKAMQVGKHGQMPVPRPGQQSHHGVMSAWVKSKTGKYNPDLAPAILMPEASHRATFGVFNKWRADMRQKMGGTFDWSKVSEAEARALSRKMFDAAQVPAAVRQQYWVQFNRMKAVLGI